MKADSKPNDNDREAMKLAMLKLTDKDRIEVIRLALESAFNFVKTGRLCPNDTNGDGDCG